MNTLTYADIYDKTKFQAWKLLAQQVATKLSHVNEIGCWGTEGVSRDYVPTYPVVYQVLRDNVDDFIGLKFTDELEFSKTYSYKKWFYPDFLATATRSKEASLLSFICTGILACMRNYQRADRSPQHETSSISDILYTGDDISYIWKAYTDGWNVGTSLDDFVMYATCDLRGVYFDSAEVLLQLSEITCSFNRTVGYSSLYNSFIYVEVLDET